MTNMISKNRLLDMLERNPVIPAVKDDESLKKALESENNIVFILYGDILNVGDIVDQLRQKGKFPFIHVDMVTGLASSPVVVEYIAKHYQRKCGILTTKSVIIKKAVESDVRVVQRVFALDSMSIENNLYQIRKNRPDAIEIMPGVIPKVIRSIKEGAGDLPIIGGGLIETKEEIMDVLKNGGIAVSTSRKSLWEI